MMQNNKITQIIREWRTEANVRTPVMYKTFKPKGGDIDWLYIITDKPNRMMECESKYIKRLEGCGAFKKSLNIEYDNVDYIVF